MIINTGNRTDIPAFYSHWFCNRIEAGFVCVRNPYDPGQVTRYLLDPEVVDCIVFCTKNPAPMLDRLDRISGFHQFWSVTITPYGEDIEPFVPPVEHVMASFKRLSELVGLNSISWRYDPILITEKYSLDFHLKAFQRMTEELEGFTDNCVISFLDLYEKTKRNFPEGRTVVREERLKLGEAFVQIGKKHGMVIRPCGEGSELEAVGADCRGCLSAPVLERAVGFPLSVPASARTRSVCSCILGSDIGAYNTCGHGCRYCYANDDRETVRENRMRHDPRSPFLVGDFMEGDRIHAAEQESCIRRQISIEDLLSI